MEKAFTLEEMVVLDNQKQHFHLIFADRKGKSRGKKNGFEKANQKARFGLQKRVIFTLTSHVVPVPPTKHHGFYNYSVQIKILTLD